VPPPAGPSAPAVPPIADSCQSIAEKMCSLQELCEAHDYALWSTRDHCIQRTKSACVNRRAPPPNLAAGLAACSKETASWSCGEYYDAGYIRSCEPLGTLGTGEQCATDRDCESGFCGSESGACGRCVKPIRDGDKCDRAPTHCLSGSYCAEGRCQQSRKIGESCLEVPCAAGLACNGVPGEQVCEKAALAGERCGDEQFCASRRGLKCNDRGFCVRSIQVVAAPSLADNADCSDQKGAMLCGWPSVCWKNKCQLPPTACH
jgi:hypothetical protein